MKKKLYKTVIQIEVLSEEPIESMSLDDIQEECSNGSFSGLHTFVKSNVPIKGKVAVNECKKHGTDVDFFMMDSEGNEIEF